jgi:hypothetical protein
VETRSDALSLHQAAAGLDMTPEAMFDLMFE